jgi:DNA-binding XRE family transcriptional regulator
MLTYKFDPDSQSSTASENRYIGASKDAVAVLESSHAEGITLEALAYKLAQANPEFATALREEAKTFAPLATTEDGHVTITSLRMAAGLTQKEFAEKINLKQPNVSAMESGQRANPTRDSMHLMCKVLNCAIATLDDAIENSKRMLESHRARQERAAHARQEERSAA